MDPLHLFCVYMMSPFVVLLARFLLGFSVVLLLDSLRKLQDSTGPNKCTPLNILETGNNEQTQNYIVTWRSQIQVVCIQ